MKYAQQIALGKENADFTRARIRDINASPTIHGNGRSLACGGIFKRKQVGAARLEFLYESRASVGDVYPARRIGCQTHGLFELPRLVAANTPCSGKLDRRQLRRHGGCGGGFGLRAVPRTSTRDDRQQSESCSWAETKAEMCAGALQGYRVMKYYWRNQWPDKDGSGTLPVNLPRCPAARLPFGVASAGDLS